jgi:hypothetical protein
MQLFVLFEVLEIDYEGTETKVRGIYKTRKKAFAKVKEFLPKAVETENVFYMSKSRSDNHYYEIGEYVVDQFYDGPLYG